MPTIPDPSNAYKVVDGVVKNPTNAFAFGKDNTTIAKKLKGQKQFGAPTILSTRHTWSEQTGYNTSEFYVGDRSQMWLAFNDPRFVCGAQQVVLDEDQDSRRSTMTIDFSHRTRREAQANYAQPEEFKDVWTLESQVENVEIWRHPRYSRLNALDGYTANSKYPLGRLIVLATQQYERIFLQAVATQIQETATDLSGTTPAEGFPGVASLTRQFNIWDYVKQPTGDGSQDAIDLGRCLADNILKGKTTHQLFRQVVTNRSVVPSNARYAQNIFPWRAGYVSTRQLCWIILQNIYGLENARSRTPAGCRPVSASKWSLIQGLLNWYGQESVVWLPYAPSIVELTNGSFEITRNWVEQFTWEIDGCITEHNTNVNDAADPIVDNNGNIAGPTVTGPDPL